jgi:hypothetical protein
MAMKYKSHRDTTSLYLIESREAERKLPRKERKRKRLAQNPRKPVNATSDSQSAPIKFLKRASEITNVFIEFLLNLSHIVLRLCQILWIWERPRTGSAGKIFAVTGNLPYQNAFFH